MINRLKLIGLIFLFTYSKLYSQHCIIKNPIKLGGNQLNEGEILKMINKHASVIYSGDQINGLRSSINQCQKELSENINVLDRKFSGYSLVKQEFHKLNNFKQEEDLLLQLEKERGKIKQTIDDNIGRLTYKGLFLVVLKDIHHLGNVKEYADTAEKLMSHKAIDNIAGMYIKSNTEVIDSKELRDIISSYVSGSFSIDEVFISNKRNLDKIYVYLAKVKVGPLKQAPEMYNNKVLSSYKGNYSVINVLTEDYESVLKEIGATHSAIDEIHNKIEDLSLNIKNSIENDNLSATESKKKYLTDGQQNIVEQDRKIQAKKLEIEQNAKKLKDLMQKETPELLYDEKQKDESGKKAIESIAKKMHSVNEEKKKIISKELKAQYQVSVPATENVPAEIASMAMKKTRELVSSYEKLHEFIEVTEIENSTFKSYKVGEKLTIYRDIDTVWLYLEPDNENNFKLSIVAKFKLVDKIKPKPDVPDNSSVTDSDGNTYKTVTIGTQTWMAENLKTSKYNDGTRIPNITDNEQWSNLTTGAWCYYDNNLANNAKYGKLYNWYAVSKTTNGNKNICPIGWHVPTDAEWTVLTDYLGGKSVAGGKMKEVGTNNWKSPNTDATNTSLFTGLPGGSRNYFGFCYYIGPGGYWWSSTELNTYDVLYRYLDYESGYAYRDYYYKNYGFSVRCLRD